MSSRTCQAAMVAALAASCGDPAARVQLMPLGGDCGRLAGANEVKVTAYGPSGSRAESVGLGGGPSGPLSTAEYYDPTVAAFLPQRSHPGLTTGLLFRPRREPGRSATTSSTTYGERCS